MKKFVFIACILPLLFSSCNIGKGEDEMEPSCPLDAVTFDSPYSDPVWHPSGEVIGFNYTPLKSITYTYGYDCPHHAAYEKDYEKRGFYLVNADGSNQWMALPYYLYSPAWSPNGEWIAFSDARGVIYKMPFDGYSFDTTRITPLATEGRNFHPSWSPDGRWIAYSCTICDPCGVFYMNSEGKNHKQLSNAYGKPDWFNKDEIFFHRAAYEDGKKVADTLKTFDIINEVSHNKLTRTDSENIDSQEIKYNCNLATGVFSSLSLLLDKPGINIWSFRLNDSEVINLYKLKSGGMQPNWGPNNQIVFLNFDHTRIDEEQGTLWIMDADGSNHRQLTFHHDLEIIIP